MTTESGGRVDSASKVIRASAEAIYEAYMDPKALASWLPPSGMSAHIDEFEPHPGGTFRFVMTYNEGGSSVRGKSTELSDVVRGRFLELVPGERIVQSIEFESADPMFAGQIKLSWLFRRLPEGTDVMIRADNVPLGIRPEDHAAGFESTLRNLAEFVERAPRT